MPDEKPWEKTMGTEDLETLRHSAPYFQGKSSNNLVNESEGVHCRCLA
jgi:hypothetical protein